MEKENSAQLRFCQECNNMLYPKEDKRLKRLKYVCKRCDYEEIANVNCVYRNNLKFNEDYRFQTTNWKEFAQDPTLPKYATTCPKCGHGEAAVQSDFGSKFATMKMYLICTNPDCGRRWIPTSN